MKDAENDSFAGHSSTSITMAGYLSGSLVNSVTYNLTTDFLYYPANFTGIDEIVFQSSGAGRYWLMDDMVVNSAAVPEPATMLLLGTGLIGLAGFGRKKFIQK